MLTVDREIYIQQCNTVHHAIREAKTKYLSEIIVGFEGDQKELFKSLDTLLKGRVERKYPSSNSTEGLANNFADYFESKIANIRVEVAYMSVAAANYFPDSSLYQSEVKFHQFLPVTETEMKGLSGKVACKSCHLDPVPLLILKIILDALLPLITKITNLSISEAIMPSRLKSASLSLLFSRRLR